jgi:hypothetical protein
MHVAQSLHSSSRVFGVDLKAHRRHVCSLKEQEGRCNQEQKLARFEPWCQVRMPPSEHETFVHSGFSYGRKEQRKESSRAKEGVEQQKEGFLTTVVRASFLLSLVVCMKAFTK